MSGGVRAGTPARGATDSRGAHGANGASVEWRAEVGGVEVLFGRGALGELGALARELGGRRALVVTDPGVRAAGHVDGADRGDGAAVAVAVLGAAGVAVEVFDAVSENPTTLEVEAGRDAAARFGADLLIGLGGGSAMDCAKGINFLVTNGGRMEDYRGFGHASQPMLPSIGVPTTAGTGSEAQSFALLSLPESHQKIACGDRQARFRIVVLDPALAATAPRRAAAAAGLDALAHAVESVVCRRANPVSRLFSCAAWALIEPHLEGALAAPAAEARPAAPPATEAIGRVLLGAHFAGAAIEASMLGAAHAGANPLTAHYGIAHGAAVGLLLPHVVRFNSAADTAVGYEQLAGCASGEALAVRIEALRAVAGLPSRLRDEGVDEAALSELAREAAGQWTAAFNPRRVGFEELLHIYREAY
jgi:alcohol dehydrogenase